MDKVLDRYDISKDVLFAPQEKIDVTAVADQGDQRQIPPPGAQHIGRADVARADLAQVARAAQPRRDDAERDRSQQVAADET